MNLMVGYFDEDWQRVAPLLPPGADEAMARRALEAAALAYTLEPTLKGSGFPSFDHAEARDLAQSLQALLAYDFIEKNYASLYRELDRFIQTMDGLSDIRRQQSNDDKRRGIKTRPQDKAKFSYYDAVLKAWQDAGGRLATSKHPITGDVRGPLVRFFLAAVTPVMSEHSPTAATIPGIVTAARKRIQARALSAPSPPKNSVTPI